MLDHPATSTFELHHSARQDLQQLIRTRMAQAEGWLAFDNFMALALYAPGLGYYANDSRQFGKMPQSGSDFVTAPEMTPLFGQTLVAQVDEALIATNTQEVWEFGAGSGALALQILRQSKGTIQRYVIVELSATLRERQQGLLTEFGNRVQWVDTLPDQLSAVVIGNEVLDAMPVKILHRVNSVWYERGVVNHGNDTPAGSMPDSGMRFQWHDRPTDLRPPIDIEGSHDYLTEIHPQAEAFIRSLAERLVQGAAFFLDYGFPENEYYHPQRHMGTLMCHQNHLADSNPLSTVGLKDITSHVNFTGIALAAQDTGLNVLGYVSQARFLINCGLPALLDNAPLAERSQAQALLHEHEMGELFKVIALSKNTVWKPLGYSQGDRTHTL